MRTAKSIVPLLILLSTAAFAAEEDASGRGIGCWVDDADGLRLSDSTSFAANEKIELTSGGAAIEADGSAEFEGPIEIRSGLRSLKADDGSYNAATGLFNTTGDISYQDADSKISGKSARYNSLSGQSDFGDAEFEFRQVPARGTAEKISVIEEGVLEVETATYTSCPSGNDDWLLKAKKIEIDTNTGMGAARGASLRFKGVPFIYLPYFTYPVSDQRKSGLLFPKLASSDQRGIEFTQPIYWNIAPEYDATIVPRYMSERGLQMGTEARYLARNHNVLAWGDYLSNDEKAGIDRWQLDLKTQSLLAMGWRGTIDASAVSDDNYFEELNSSQRLATQTNLSRNAALEYYDPVWSVKFQVQDYQTIDSLITPDEEPYIQLPRLDANGEWNNGWLGMDYRLDTEAVYFDRQDSVTGSRVHLAPQISLPLERNGIYLIPEVVLDYTSYQLQDAPVGVDASPSRTAPIASLDLGAAFERTTGKRDQWIMTLEPRAQYTYIPFREQDDIPIFDTIRPDFNIVQLYEKNRFVGYDRLGDTEKLSMGVTARFLDADNGREVLTATVGQARFFETRLVTLPGNMPTLENSTDYIAELGVNVWKNWGVDASVQWDQKNRNMERASMRFRYNPGDFKAVNVAYRYAQDTLEQTDVSFSWPLANQWNVIGRYNYSLVDAKPIDRFLGVEYGSCCWGISVVARKTVSRSTGQSDSSVSLQFVLKGFSNLGSSSSSDLQRDILTDQNF